MRVVDHLEVWGHPNITALNRTTFEFTKESHLTRQGDCVVGVRSTKGAVELSPAFKALARDDSAAVIVEVSLDDVTAVVVGRGSRGLSYSHPTDLVGRRSGYTCGRTLMIGADKGAGDFPRDLVEAMRDPAQRAKVTVIVDSDMVGGRSFDDVSRRRCLQQPW